MNHPSWDTLAIVGVGLIGGSIGLAARERGLVNRVIGIGRRNSSLQVARDAEVITETTTDLARGVSTANVIVVCTPVDLIAEQVCQIAQHCRPNALITDAGSTKAGLVRTIESSIGGAIRFVGSHPLAGSHESGPNAARGDLLDGRTVIVTPTDNTAAQDTEEITRFWTALGANVVRMDCDAHDEALAASSHVPHLVAAALASATPEEVQDLVAGGWSDTTRIAGAKPELWAPIFRQNRSHVLAALSHFSTTLDAFRAALDQDDVAELQRLLEVGKQKRDAINK